MGTREEKSYDPDDEIPSEEEKEMLRYYYYVKHGVDTVHVAPLDEKVLARVSICSQRHSNFFYVLLFCGRISQVSSISMYNFYVTFICDEEISDIN